MAEPVFDNIRLRCSAIVDQALGFSRLVTLALLLLCVNLTLGGLETLLAVTGIVPAAAGVCGPPPVEGNPVTTLGDSS